MFRVDKLKWLRELIANPPNECVIWPWSCDRIGYAHLHYKGKLTQVTRIVLHLATNFDLNSPLEAAHSCDNKPCVNIKHLSPKTRLQNMREAAERKRWKTQIEKRCMRGHSMTGENVMLRPDGRRECRTCTEAWRQTYASVKR